MAQRIFLFPIHNALSLMHIGLPFHIFEPRYRQMVKDAIENDVPVAVTFPSVDYRGRIIAAGVPQIISQYEDGRMDILLRGEFKGRLETQVEDRPYKVFTVEELVEDTRLTQQGRFYRECLRTAILGWASKQLTTPEQTAAFKEVIADEISMISYATLFLIDHPTMRQRILDEQCLDRKAEMIVKAWGPKEISLGHFLEPIRL